MATQNTRRSFAVYERLPAMRLIRILAPAQIIGFAGRQEILDAGPQSALSTIPKNFLLDDEESGKPGLLRIASNIVHGGNFYGNARSNLCTEKILPCL